MAIDGDFGPKTKRGYEILREKFGTGGIDPTASGDNFRVWLDLIGRHGIADKPAGTFRAAAMTTTEATAASD
jgi:hypothetical protein